MDIPADTPKKKKDQRPTLTFKGEEFGPEFRALINKAAERSGMSQSQFVAETLRREAQRILKGTPSDTPADTPALPAVQTERLDAQDRCIADLAEQVRRLVELQTAAQTATLWDRLRGVFWVAARGVQGQRAA
jgi:hypothetical protein